MPAVCSLGLTTRKWLSWCSGHLFVLLVLLTAGGFLSVVMPAAVSSTLASGK
jgi:hypothetical protein